MGPVADARSVSARALLILSIAAAPVVAQPPPAASSAPPPVRAGQIAPRLYVLTGGGGANSTLLLGEHESLLVDSKSAAAVPQIVAITKDLGGAPIRYLINGHVHPDHTSGNEALGKAGVTIIGHEQVREVLAAGQRGGPPAPVAALPTLTFPDGGGVTLFVDGEQIDVRHAPPAHSPDNSIVHYRNANVLHLGDLYGPNRYQLIAGGTFQGFIDAADIALTMADDETKIVPGVGAVGTRANLVAYRYMLVTIRDRVAQLVREHKTLEQVVAAKPTAEFDAIWGSPDHMLFLPVIYAELAGQR